ncbi:hypothetical protein WN48_09994 [Eufriesea mexicana]|uniref:Cytochrome P450 305a1 n=1 Tax=Eufriesea mexicana TaxID=516756 RepID=A0A310S9G1_9HYME|nr:hypothetical protein WN48_09994 [Eufriesea mexicana]
MGVTLIISQGATGIVFVTIRPKWLPLIGCIFAFRRLKLKHKYAFLAFQELTKTYGPILGLKLGNQKVVVISTHDLVKKVLLQDEFNGRPDGFFFKVRAFGKKKGQSIMEKHLTIEAQNLVNYLHRASAKGPVLMHTAFDIAVLNSLWYMFAGHTFDYENEKLQEILQTVHDAFRLMDTMGGIVSQMPFLRFIIPELSGYNDLMRILQKLWNFLDEEISVHEKQLSRNQPENLIEAFLLEISSKSSDCDDSIFNRENLLVVCLDLFLAGSKTTTDTLAAIFLFLSLHPEWIKILQKELDTVLGRSRSPSVEDYSSLPMMESFLAEIQRFLNLAPFGLPHKTMKNTILNGYTIPKNNSNIPFGLGKRRCPGETLARTTLFLFFAYVIHYFDIEISPEHGKPDPDGHDGFTISPKSYYLKLTARSDIINSVTV